MGKVISLGESTGIQTLKPAGHARREQLARRADKLAKAAEILTKQAEIYSIDREKLKEEPEILAHFNFADKAFEVSNPKKGMAYYWERDDSRMISWRKGQARLFLGPNHPGWEVVSGHDSSCDAGKLAGKRCHCEAAELIQADGTRKIGDVLLMTIPVESYVHIQKRILLMQKFRESNIAQKLSDFVRENEGLVQVHTMVGQSPREYFGKKGIPLVHTDSQESNFAPVEVQAGRMVGSEEEE